MKYVFTEAEKQQLIKEVQKQAAVWDIAHKDHCNSSVLFAAWSKISNQLGRSIEECKSAWKSIKAKERYQKKKKGKSSTSLEDTQETDSDVQIYETPKKDLFNASPVVALMRLPGEKRRTFTYMSKNGENTDDGGEGSSSCSYTIGDANKKARVAGSENSLEQSVKEFIELKKSTVAPKQQLKNYAMLSNLDNMLKDLPIDVIHELNVAFVNMTYEKIKECKIKK